MQHIWTIFNNNTYGKREIYTISIWYISLFSHTFNGLLIEIQRPMVKVYRFKDDLVSGFVVGVCFDSKLFSFIFDKYEKFLPNMFNGATVGARAA